MGLSLAVYSSTFFLGCAGNLLILLSVASHSQVDIPSFAFRCFLPFVVFCLSLFFWPFIVFVLLLFYAFCCFFCLSLFFCLWLLFSFGCYLLFLAFRNVLPFVGHLSSINSHLHGLYFGLPWPGRPS